MVLRVAGCSSWNWYGKKPEVPLQKRGPKPQLSDYELLSPYRHDKAMVKVRKHEGKIVQGKPDLLWGTDGKKFFDETQQEVFPQPDFWMCIKRDIFPIVIKAERQQGMSVNRAFSLQESL